MTPNSFSPIRQRFATVLLLLSLTATALAQRQMERLGRGVVALHSATSQAYVGWRLLATDPTDVGFNLYRSANGAAGVKLNALPLTNTTDFLDTTANFTLSNAWYVVPVTNGAEATPGAAYGLAANSPVRQYVPIPLVAPGAFTPYDVKFCWVGDFDGDGEYDFLVDRMSTTGGKNQFLQAYKRDGTFLWQMDMGFLSTNTVNAYEPDAAAISVGDKDNVTVYDLDGDGRAEVIVRAANGTILPNGTMITTNNNTSQFLCILDGLTGIEKARALIPNPYFADGPLNCHAGIAYFDGIHPSILFSGENRVGGGAFQRLAIAWDFRDGKLTQRWLYQTPSGQNDSEGHQLRIADVKHDGKDDVVRIGGVIADSNGVPVTLYSTESAHGDRYHVTDIDPDRPGLEMYSIQQLNSTLLATSLQDLGSGQLFKKWYSASITDVGRGITADITPNTRGCEMYSTQPGIFDAKGTQIYASSVWAPEGIWWDADVLREFEDGAGSGALNPVINKFDPVSGTSGRLYTLYNEDGGCHQAYGGRAAFWGDILGDWREEFIVIANDYNSMRIYTTKLTATNRLYCLMQNPQYRVQSTFKGYYQASYVDYFLGYQMPPPPPPPVSDARLVWRGNGTNIWDTASANWFTNNLWISNNVATTYSSDSTVLFDATGTNTTVALNGALSPAWVTVHSPKNYTFEGSNGFLTGSMKLTKAGAGKLFFNGTNTYTGPTLVGEGSLIVNGALANSPVTVRGGIWLDGRLGGTGLVSSPVGLNEGAGFSPGQGTNSPGTLTIANTVTLTGRTLNDFDLSDDATGTVKTNDLLVINGNLTVTGTNAFVIRKLNATLPPGSIYPLINYSGTFSGSLNNFTVSGLTGVPLTLTNPPGQIALVIKSFRAPALLTWTGGSGGNTWDLLTTSNWLNGLTKDQFAPGDTVRFDNTGAPNPTVTQAGDLICAGLMVDATNNYVLTGGGDVIGTGGLTKTNTGTLTISALNNAFTGKTILAGGTLVVSELDAIGYPSPLGNPPGGSTNLVLSGSPTLRVTGESYTDRGLTINAGINTLEVTNSTDQVTIAGIITGSGTLQKTGAGTLAVSANNTFTGPTYILGGNISLGGGTANQYGLGVGPGGNGNTTLTISNATLTMFSDSGSYDTCYWNVIVPTNATATIYGDDRVNLYGTLTGGGTLNFNVYYVRTELDGNWSTFTGQLNLGTDSAGGDFRIGNSAGYANASVNLADYIYAYHITAGAAVSLGSLTGGTYSHLTGTAWTIGAKNLDSTYAGSINGNSLTKVGTGTLTLSGNTNNYSGTTTISAGTLQIGSGGTAGTIGTGAITDNATLAFNRSDVITDTNFGIISGAGNLVKRGAGMLTLSKAHIFSGATTIEAGTLALTNSGAIGNSTNINLAAGALLDVSGTTGGAMTLTSGKTLSGFGTVNGNFTIGSGAKLAPGGSIGTLTFNQSLTLGAGCTNFFEISKNPLTNDVARIFGGLTNGGILIVTNLSTNSLAAGNSFKLFNAASYSGTFANLVLPPLPAGLGWNTNSLNTNGTLTVIITIKPVIGSLTFAGNGLSLTGTGGVANANYYLLGASNISTPAVNWLRLLTNQFDANGNFNFNISNAPNTNWPQGYYRLLVP